MVTTMITLAFCSPWFISKKPMRQAVHFRPAVLWGVIALYFLLGNASHQLWPAVGLGFALSAVVIGLAWRGANRVPLARVRQ